jgi:uncharacterized protein YgfB (UPF0149 family)
MNEPDGNQTRSPFQLCAMAEEQDEALTDVMALAQAGGDMDLDEALAALADIHDLVKSYLDAR